MNESIPELNNQEKYLQSGEQTQITPEVLAIASKFDGSVLNKVSQIIEKVSSLENRRFNGDIFRKRTGDQILKDGFITGCTDLALVFIILARASSIPAKYIETIDKKWLKEGGLSIGGHIYSEIYDEENGEWHWVDPMAREIDITPEAKSRIVFKEGLDSWDIGIKDYESLSTLFNEFRKNWLENENR